MNVCLPSPYGEAENQTVQSSAKLLDLLGRGKRQSEICVARSLNRPLDRCSWMLDVSKPMGSENFSKTIRFRDGHFRFKSCLPYCLPYCLPEPSGNVPYDASNMIFNLCSN